VSVAVRTATDEGIASSTVTVKVEPAPCSLSTVMSPPMARAMRWLIASPRPVPP
jgi:hypothetical protein